MHVQQFKFVLDLFRWFLCFSFSFSFSFQLLHRRCCFHVQNDFLSLCKCCAHENVCFYFFAADSIATANEKCEMIFKLFILLMYLWAKFWKRQICLTTFYSFSSTFIESSLASQSHTASLKVSIHVCTRFIYMIFFLRLPIFMYVFVSFFSFSSCVLFLSMFLVLFSGTILCCILSKHAGWLALHSVQRKISRRSENTHLLSREKSKTKKKSSRRNMRSFLVRTFNSKY